MSNLGIRNVLSYKGANGIKVIGSTISIDESATIHLKKVTGDTTEDAYIDYSGVRLNKNTIGDISQNVQLLVDSLRLRFISVDNIVLYENNIVPQQIDMYLYANDGSLIAHKLDTSKILSLVNNDAGNSIELSSDNGLYGSGFQFSVDGWLNITGNQVRSIGVGVGEVVLDTTKYVPIEINNITYKLLISQ